MHPYLRYYFLIFVSYGLVFLLLQLGISYSFGEEGESLTASISTAVFTAAIFAAFMLHMEVRGLKKAGIARPGWEDLGGDYGEELNLPLSVADVLALLANDPRFLVEKGEEPGDYRVLNRVFGHYGKHHTFLTMVEEEKGSSRLRLENRSKNACQLSDMGYSRQQYEEIKRVLVREGQKWTH